MIVEPVAASTGVLPPPKGYLERLRAICDKHGILLIFDEVITGFGRLGYPFAAERYGVIPDMITFAKGVTSGAVPMGGVIVRKGHLRCLHEGARTRHRAVPRLHLFGASVGLRRRPWPRSTFTATKACSSARASSKRMGAGGHGP